MFTFMCSFTESKQVAQWLEHWSPDLKKRSSASCSTWASFAALTGYRTRAVSNPSATQNVGRCSASAGRRATTAHYTRAVYRPVAVQGSVSSGIKARNGRPTADH